jgi:FkbH-like protein
LQWLRYGSLAAFDEWSVDVQSGHSPVALVLLLVRLSDLEAAHPELQLASRADGVANGPINQFVCDLERYDATATACPLVVLLCPSPAATFEAMERDVLRRIGALQKVAAQSSERLVSLFQQQYTPPFYDAVADKRLHSPFTQAMLNVLSLALCRQISRLFRGASSRKKVIVLDCDNTLWGGAVAEVGAGGIDLGPRFLALQRFVVAQQQHGMLLALCSKNLFADVAEAFKQRRDAMVLDMDKHVVAARVNWQPKSQNIALLAEELSLGTFGRASLLLGEWMLTRRTCWRGDRAGLDSFVFIDDNPLEFDDVPTALPSVAVIPLGQDFSEAFLDGEWVFDDALGAATATREDGRRTQLYQQSVQRAQLRESASTHQAFLSALGVKVVFEELDRKRELRARSSSFTRALQLHQRTNQFNTATTFAKRMDEHSLLAYVAAAHHTVVCAHVTDRFGHYGLVSVALCQRVREGDALRVDSFLLSCRALNRGVEHAMTRRVGDVAARAGATSLAFAWEPTERNQPAHAFFSVLSGVTFTTDRGLPPKPVDLGLSSSSSGAWVISVAKASTLAFLKPERSALHGVKRGGLVGWLLRCRPTRWLRELALSMLRRTLSCVALPRWAGRLLQPSLVQRLTSVGTPGMLRVPLRARGSLEQFLAPALRDIPRLEVSGAATADSGDDRFRRKARHQSKLALVDHLHPEVPREIWSANRPHTDASGAPVGGARVCESPQCSAAVQRESRCAFQRCRTCCYRIQRLLTRSLHHASAAARQSAVNALQDAFAVDASSAAVKDGQPAGPDAHWCPAHRNQRRRGELLGQKRGSA